MRLSPREEDHLLLHAAGALAQKRLARGVKLNYPEAVALIATQVCVLHEFCSFHRYYVLFYYY
jgi:urease subunit gamma/beta